MTTTERFVVQGEASESDEDEVSELYDLMKLVKSLRLILMTNFQDTTNCKHGVRIVDGEAPESDEGMNCSWYLTVSHNLFVPISEIASFSNLPSVNYMGAHLKPNYSPLASPLRIRTVEESLLHKKLCMPNHV